MLGLFPFPVFFSGLMVWMGLFFTTRYVSLASLGSAITLPTASFVLVAMGRCEIELAWVATAMCLLAFWRHRGNIQRLLSGTEKRFERGKKSSHEPQD